MNPKCCKQCGLSKPPDAFYTVRGLLRERCKACCVIRSQARYWANPKRVMAKQAARTRKAPQAAMAAHARAWDRRHGLVPDIHPHDIEIPPYCPILGIPLVRGTRQDSSSSPCIDRVVPAVGLAPGNWYVCSVRAQRIRNGRTEEEVRRDIVEMEAQSAAPEILATHRTIYALLQVLSAPSSEDGCLRLP
jgi:hypothetical protein